MISTIHCWPSNICRRYQAVEEELEELKATEIQTPAITSPLFYEQTGRALLPAPLERNVNFSTRDDPPSYESPLPVEPRYSTHVFKAQRIDDVEISASGVSQLIHL